jgi:hypothetical protein
MTRVTGATDAREAERIVANQYDATTVLAKPGASLSLKQFDEGVARARATIERICAPRLMERVVAWVRRPGLFRADGPLTVDTFGAARTWNQVGFSPVRHVRDRLGHQALPLADGLLRGPSGEKIGGLLLPEVLVRFERAARELRRELVATPDGRRCLTEARVAQLKPSAGCFGTAYARYALGQLLLAEPERPKSLVERFTDWVFAIA